MMFTSLANKPFVVAPCLLSTAACGGQVWQLNGDMVCENARQRLADAIVKAIQRPVALPDMPIRRL